MEIRVDVMTGDCSFVAISVNISPGGLFLTAPARYRLGDHLLLAFKLPEQERAITVAAEVCWIRASGNEASGAGVRFLNPSVEATLAIQEFRRALDDDLTPSGPST